MRLRGFNMNFDDWWHETGSGIKPLEGDDMEEHAKRVAKASWFFAKIDKIGRASCRERVYVLV